jgi:hypothetical protein
LYIGDAAWSLGAIYFDRDFHTGILADLIGSAWQARIRQFRVGFLGYRLFIRDLEFSYSGLLLTKGGSSPQERNLAAFSATRDRVKARLTHHSKRRAQGVTTVLMCTPMISATFTQEMFSVFRSQSSVQSPREIPERMAAPT